MHTLFYVIIMISIIPIILALYLVFRLALQGESYNSKSWYNRIKKIIGLK